MKNITFKQVFAVMIGFLLILLTVANLMES